MAELPEEPNPSEGLLASWGRRLLAALRSMRLRVGPGLEIRQDSEGTTILLAKPPPDPNRERPFRARFMRKSGSGANVETALYVYLPPESAEAVRWKGSVVPPAAAQDLGTAENPWVEFEGGKVYIEITLARQTGTGMSGELEPTEWKLATSASAASDTKWYHLVAAVEEGVGLVQYHLGSLLLGFGADLPCPDEYSVEEQSGTLPTCVAKRYVFKRQHYEKDSNGDCQAKTGTGASEETNIDIPAPPEISASATGHSGSGQKAGTITVAACDGTTRTIDVYNGEAGAPGVDGADGCSPDISVTVLEPGSTQGGETGGFLVAIQNYERVNGQCVAVGDLLTFVVKNGTKGEDGDPGADGCTPTVTAGTTPAVHGDLAATITPCGEDATPISIYHGRNGTDGAVCGSFAGFAGMKFENGVLYYGTQAYQFALNSATGCYEPQATGGVVWTAVSGLDFYTCTPSS